MASSEIPAALRSALLSGVFLLGLVPSAQSQEHQAPLVSEERRRAIEEITRNYLRANPDVILRALDVLRVRQQQQFEERAREQVKARTKDLVDDPMSPVLGNPDGDVTIVEFIDYRCPHCRHVEESIRNILRTDRKVRVVYKQLPLLGPASVLAAQVAVVAWKSGKYAAFHQGMMALSGNVGEKEIGDVARSIGLGADNLKSSIDAPDVRAVLSKDIALARALSLRGTPSFVVGSELIPGATDQTTLMELVAEARHALR